MKNIKKSIEIRKRKGNIRFDILSEKIKGKISFLLLGFTIFSLGFKWSAFDIDAIMASLEITKSANVASIPTGENFIYTLNYRCASLTEDCLGTFITDALPPEVEFIAVYGSTHTTNEVYDSGTHTVTFDFIPTLLSGTVGQVQIEVRFPNGPTPNGTIASNIANIDASNAPLVSSNNVDVTATAEDKLNVHKFLDGGGVPGEVTVYSIEICNVDEGVIEPGTMTATNITVIDTLPPGTEFLYLDGTGTYDPVSHTANFTPPDLAPGECYWPSISLRYPEPLYAIGDTVVNTAYVSYAPVGGTPITGISSATDTLTNPLELVGFIKRNTQASLYPGETGIYTIDWWNDSNVELPDFHFIDTIPPGLEVLEIGLGAHYINTYFDYDSIKLNLEYQTNLNTVWTTSPNSPFELEAANTGDSEPVSNLGLAAGEFITMIKWQFGPDPMPVSSGAWIEMAIDYQVMPSATPGIVTNCFTAWDSLGLITSFSTPCVDLEILALNAGATLNPIKSVLPFSNVNPGDTVSFQIAIRNEGGAGDSLGNPIAYDLLPEGITYVPGTWNIPAWGNLAGFPNPTFTQTVNYNGTGRELLVWEWSGGSAIEIPPNERVVIQFDAKIPDVISGGITGFTNETLIQGDDISDCMGTEIADVNDLDGDGNTTETICMGDIQLTINAIAALESEKLVKGQLDTVWTKYPEVGNTLPGGKADYQLQIRNPGTVGMTEIVIIDILPHVGDSSVVTLLPRDSRWTSNLVGPVLAPVGVTVYYSLETNPCRDVEGIVPSGPPSCAAPNWSTVPPTDITTVRSLKFDFGSTVLNPGEEIVLEWPMRAPVTALDAIGAMPDSIAWNSFGFIAERADNGATLLASEPIKVGIDIAPLSPGIYGDLVWVDTNMDGIQDAGEPGYNGMRVELFKDNGDGISDPTLDTFVNFTVTANDGLYLFSALEAGDYYAVFYKPAPFGISPADIGVDDELDSDGVGVIQYNNLDVIVMPVTYIGDTDYDYSWDLGIYNNNLSAVGNYVWNDLNSDGIQNESTINGVNGITVNLYGNSNPSNIVASYVTQNDANGNPGFYIFDQLTPGDYFLDFINPSGVTFSPQGVLGESSNSDAHATTGLTEVFTLVANQYNQNLDAGLVLPLDEVCDNNFDDNQNGLLDCDDPDCDCCEIKAPTLSRQ